MYVEKGSTLHEWKNQNISNVGSLMHNIFCFIISFCNPVKDSCKIDSDKTGYMNKKTRYILVLLTEEILLSR